MHLTSYPTLNGASESWLRQLQSGDASPLRALLAGVDVISLFKVGMASAERGLLGGVQAAISALEAEARTDLLQPMGRHWLEASILCEHYKVAYYLRALPIDPMLDRDRAKEDFAGSSFNSRRTSRIDESLRLIEGWGEEFIEQVKNSQLFGSALFRAIHHHPPTCVARLIELGVCLNSPAEGYYPLWAAMRSGKAPVLQMLLDAGASIEVAGLHAGKTLLVAAAERGQEPCIWALVNHGASLSDRSCGIDAAHSARAAGYVQLASKLEAYALSYSPPASSSAPSRRL